MATLVMTKQGLKAIKALDASVQPKVWNFLEKLSEDDTQSGLRIKPLKQAIDRRVRTGRVNDDYRAVLFRVDHEGEAIYHMAGVWPHDEGNAKALSMRLNFNTALGVAEVTQEESAETGPSWQEAYEQGRAAGLEQGIAAASQRDNPLENHYWTVETLVQDAGIAEHHAKAALQAPDQAGVSAVAELLPEAQKLMLLELAMGTPLAEARESLLLPDANTVEQLRQEDEDAQLATVAKNESPGFSVLGSTLEEVKAAYQELSMEEWQIFLHPEQKRYVHQSGKGSFRLTGGAGTGKTVILVHRARELHRRRLESKILLTTYTVELGESLRHQLHQLDPSTSQVPLGEVGVSVEGIDRVASRVLESATTEEIAAAQAEVFGPGRNEFRQRMAGNQETDAWKQAVVLANPTLSGGLTQAGFLSEEYSSVVLAHRITSLREYARVSRAGRGTRLSRAQRMELWKVFEQFRNGNLAADRLTFREVTVLAAVILENRAKETGSYLLDHVLVDEAQDFHPGHWQLLRALAPAGPDDLFIAEDAHQRIYGQKLTLKQFGIEIRGRSRRLKLNYRTTAQNLRFAVSVLEGERWQALEDNTEDPEEVNNTYGYTSILTGPEPKLLDGESVLEEQQAACEEVRRWQEQGVALEEIAILTRNRKPRHELHTSLMEAGMPAQVLERGSTVKPGAVQIRTMHTAKGMEFRCVLISGAGADHLPARYALRNLPEAEQNDARQRERSLLYVAATRAREELTITYSGTPSEFFEH